MFSVKRSLVVLILSFSTSAFAGDPRSFNYDTRTDFWGNDALRIEALAHAMDMIGGRLALRLYEADASGYCDLSVSCASAAQDYVGKMSTLLNELATKSKALVNVPQADRDATLAQLRVSHFNEIAKLQYALLKTFPVNEFGDLSTTGSGMVDIECRDYYGLYWMLMNRIVAYPQEAGLGDGRGTDD